MDFAGERPLLHLTNTLSGEIMDHRHLPHLCSFEYCCFCALLGHFRVRLTTCAASWSRVKSSAFPLERYSTSTNGGFFALYTDRLAATSKRKKLKKKVATKVQNRPPRAARAAGVGGVSEVQRKEPYDTHAEHGW